MSGVENFPRMGRHYSRREIHDALGGDVQSYLPSAGGRVVAICLDPRKNPAAPREILVGTGPRIRQRGDALVRQGGPLPVFLKRAAGVWEAVGSFVVESSSDDPVVLREKARLRTGNVSRVIWLSPTS